jgi:hypothetical protein
MTNILEHAAASGDDPVLVVRKAPHAAVWSVWAARESHPSEEIFEALSEAEASHWIKASGHEWIDERRRKRNS